MPVRLDRAVALVTGASSGIGAAVTRRFAAAGAQVLAAGRDETRLAKLAADTGALPLVADLARPGAGQELAERALAETGRIDVVVNNAGLGWAGDFAQMPPADIDELLALNLRAPIELTRAVLPGLRRHGGHLVYVGSIAGRLGVAGEAVYAAGKAGLDIFAASLRAELAGQDIGVSVVVPGVVDTPFFARRGRPYHRARPRPVPADRVAAALTAAVVQGRCDVYVPGWLRLPVAVRGALPGIYRSMDGRFGGRS
ncbi:SDR family NAD(P)-dependent oxidoreductase [Melissospora conviva]|uniref:SDR family NAD(P)-dependent oxidoreductase n=1 Tax=Melissospora conviva TaxID=3388432 RepID=UPI003B769466